MCFSSLPNSSFSVVSLRLVDMPFTAYNLIEKLQRLHLLIAFTMGYLRCTKLMCWGNKWIFRYFEVIISVRVIKNKR